MNKCLTLGDIHGRKIWKEIIEKENPDKIIFLGDYVSTHQNITEEEQIENLKEILNYKEENWDKVILLRGNHDTQHLGYYWARCSGYFPKVANWMSEPENKERFLRDTQWIYVDKDLKTVFSHAGISEVWLDESVGVYMHLDDITKNDWNNKQLLEIINDIKPCEIFGFIPDRPYDYYGDSVTQSCVWIRPETLCKCCIEGYTQVVGHTPVKRSCINMKEAVKGKQSIWLCDGLETGKYLVIEDGEFKPKSLNK